MNKYNKDGTLKNKNNIKDKRFLTKGLEPLSLLEKSLIDKKENKEEEENQDG